MGESSRKMIRVITNRLRNYWLLTDASIAFKQTTEKAQKQLAHAQIVAAKKYDTIVKQVNGATLIQDVNGAPLQLSDPLPKQLIVWWQWYQQLTGLDSVENAKRQVIAVQDRLFSCQEKRRQLTHHTTVINNSLSQIYGELIQTKREDPKYVQLTIMENKSLQESRKLNEELTLLENEEKDYFTQLATAIKEYHDSQTINAQKFKYLSIVASALFAIVSLIGSMIYNNKRIKDVRNVIAEAQKTNHNTFVSTFAYLEEHINSKFEKLSQITNTVKSDNSIKVSANPPFGRKEEPSSKTVALTYIIGTLVCVYIVKSIFG